MILYNPLCRAGSALLSPLVCISVTLSLLKGDRKRLALSLRSSVMLSQSKHGRRTQYGLCHHPSKPTYLTTFYPHALYFPHQIARSTGGVFNASSSLFPDSSLVTNDGNSLPFTIISSTTNSLFRVFPRISIWSPTCTPSS